MDLHIKIKFRAFGYDFGGVERSVDVLPAVTALVNAVAKEILTPILKPLGIAVPYITPAMIKRNCKLYEGQGVLAELVARS